MRIAPLVILALLAAPVAVGSTTIVKTYVATSTRDPILGAHPVCDPAATGVNVGGACFDVPAEHGWPYLKVKDDRALLGNVMVSIFSYTSDVGLPIDGKVFCAKNDRVFIPAMQLGTRIVVSVGPTNGGDQTPCQALPGTTGTITLHWS